jgi:pimeloyl-ACP methyl ester carboxylesterase
MRKYLKGLGKLAVVVLVLAILGAVILYFCQDFIVYPGRSLYRGDSPEWQSRIAFMAGRGFEPIEIEGKDGVKVKGLRCPSAAGAAPAILWFHARGENITEIASTLDVLAKTGFHVFVMQYRGYGHSFGETSEINVMADAEALFDDVCERDTVIRKRVVVGGAEWGAAVALKLAARRDAAGVLAVATVPDMATAAASTFRWAPWGLLLKDHYEVGPALGGVTCPVLFVHGADDLVVPVEDVERMASKIPARNSIHRVAGAGHERVLESGGKALQEALADFLAGAGR